jgi:hypothetical protein
MAVIGFRKLPATLGIPGYPRLDADPAHRWLRGCVGDTCAEHLTDA